MPAANKVADTKIARRWNCQRRSNLALNMRAM
jgi:hypothetical protein